jgi:small subunit ribosomal protein S20
MPNIKSAAKRAKTSMEKRTRNRSEKANIATITKKLAEVITAKDKAKSGEIFNAYASAVDKAVKKGILTRNTADRKKSRAAIKIAAIK